MFDIFLQRIRDLKAKLDKQDSLLKSFNAKIQKPDGKISDEEIKVKDQELKELRIKLTVYSQERDEVQKELDNKVKELENSNLSNDKKQAQINDLLVESKDELNLLNKSLMETWSN